MSARKSERVLNLAICLLMTKRYLTREQIRETIEGYHGLTDGAFERTFERDKDDLRSMGVPIETGSNDAFFDDELGYRIRRADFELPPVDFSRGEITALGLASKLWEQASLAEQAVSAVAKLRAAGFELDAVPLAGLALSVGAREPAFETVWNAALTRTRVTFDYRGLRRVVEPWHLTYRNGAWYLQGLDASRDAPRVFKLARFESTPELDGKPGAYQVPDGVDPGMVMRWIDPAGPDAEASLAIRGGRAPELRRRGYPSPSAPGVPPGFEAWVVPYSTGGDFVGEIARFADDVLVLGPDDLRTALIRHLKAVAR